MPSSASGSTGTTAPIWEYTGRDVHILGSTIDEALQVYQDLADSVVSMDFNFPHRSATMFAKWWGQTTPKWNHLPQSANPESFREAYENSMLNLTYKLRQEDVIA